MNATKKRLIYVLAAGAALAAAAPVFADSGRERGYDYGRDQRSYRMEERRDWREHERRDDWRGYARGYDRRQFVVVRRPIMVAPPVYYVQPAPMRDVIGPAALIGAVIGGYIDSRQ